MHDGLIDLAAKGVFGSGGGGRRSGGMVGMSFIVGPIISNAVMLELCVSRLYLYGKILICRDV